MYSIGESISVFNCIDVQEELLTYVDDCNKQCQIDATLLTDIDAAGLQLLISMKKYCDRKNLSFEMVNLQEQLFTLFTKLSLETMLIKGKS